MKPPGWQCCNGHILCNNCRSRSEKCPVCRVPLGPRGRCLLSDKLFSLLAESFPCDGGKYLQFIVIITINFRLEMPMGEGHNYSFIFKYFMFPELKFKNRVYCGLVLIAIH